MKDLHAPTAGKWLVSAAPDQVSSDLAGESVILNLKSGVYYGLNAVGARVWALVQQPTPIEAVRDALVAEYAVDPDLCDRELRTLLQALVAQGLIEVEDAAAA